MSIVKVHKELFDEIGNGYCINCQDIQYGGVEPDAEGYECEYCGRDTVMGLETALIVGLIEVSDEE